MLTAEMVTQGCVKMEDDASGACMCVCACVCMGAGQMLTLHTPTSAAASPEADDLTHTTSHPHAKTKAASINDAFVGHILLM